MTEPFDYRDDDLLLYDRWIPLKKVCTGTRRAICDTASDDCRNVSLSCFGFGCSLYSKT